MSTNTIPESSASRAASSASQVAVSIIIEWANTELNGTPRAKILLELLGRQWGQLLRHEYPEGLSPEAIQYLDRLVTPAQVLIISATPIEDGVEKEIRSGVPADFDLELHVTPGLEYYGLKNFGAERATGNLILFVDSDVEPEAGWLAHLLGTFADPSMQVVCGQTYIPPDSLYASAFSLGWTYDLRDPRGRLIQPVKVYANNIVFHAEVFRQTGFASLGKRSRGASSLLRKHLEQLGISIWENRSARVGHPPPANFQHLTTRALAHGRDHYMKHTERRTLYCLGRSFWIAGKRMCRGFARTFRHASDVGVKFWQVPAVLTIISCYYAFFAAGGLLTHISPEAMGRRFRV